MSVTVGISDLDLKKTGWSKPINSEKFHYYFDGVTLCRKFRWVRSMQSDVGPRYSSDVMHFKNCAACRDRLRLANQKKRK
jgi:hypothetical protein